MTTKGIKQMIESVGVPFAYYQFEDGTALKPPFICFYYPASDDVYADDENYQAITELTIELYSEYRDFETEALIEAALKANGLTYAKAEAHEDDEKLMEIIYETEVILNAGN